MITTKLTLLQCEVLVGILLGDASLQTESNGRTYRLRVSQSNEHKEYLFHLYEIFKNLTSSPPKQYVFTDPRNPLKKYVRWSFSTTQQSCFRFYGAQFYNVFTDCNGVTRKEKKIPKLIHKWLQPRSIAYWYMDDGAQKWKGVSLGVRFCTDNYNRQDVQRLAKVLHEKYNLQTSLQKKGKDWRIYVSSSSYDLLKSLIFSYFIESMVYKFPPFHGA
jgi:hypothetical protein